MGVGLYNVEPSFTTTMDEFFAALGAEGARLRRVWLSRSPGAALHESRNSQPLLFALGHALGAAVTARVEVSALLGHSVGELAAAATSGVFGTAEGAALMAARASAMDLSPEGGMLVVAAPPDRLHAYLGSELVIGAENNPRQTVLSGPRGPLAACAERLNAAGIACETARTVHPFHSPSCTASARAFERAFAGIPLAPPRIPIHSSRTGLSVTDAQAVTGEFWARQLDHPVLFSEATDDLLSQGRHLILEAGPAGSCLSLLKRNRLLRSTGSRVLPLLPPSPDSPAMSVFQSSLDLAGEDRPVTTG